MDQETYEKWIQIKKSLEKNGKIHNSYYKKICDIVNHPLKKK